jgi:hypothetical protein
VHSESVETGSYRIRKQKHSKPFAGADSVLTGGSGRGHTPAASVTAIGARGNEYYPFQTLRVSIFQL